MLLLVSHFRAGIVIVIVVQIELQVNYCKTREKKTFVKRWGGCFSLVFICFTLMSSCVSDYITSKVYCWLRENNRPSSSRDVEELEDVVE